MEQTECSETSAYKIQTPGNYPEENIHKLIYALHLLSILTQFLRKSNNCESPH